MTVGGSPFFLTLKPIKRLRTSLKKSNKRQAIVSFLLKVTNTPMKTEDFQVLWYPGLLYRRQFSHVTVGGSPFLLTLKPIKRLRTSLKKSNKRQAIVSFLLKVKKPLRACYCSEMLLLRYEKAPAGMLLLKNVVFEVRKSPCGHVTAQKRCF